MFRSIKTPYKNLHQLPSILVLVLIFLIPFSVTNALSICAKVDEEIISLYDLNARLTLLQKLERMDVEDPKVRAKVLDSMIDSIVIKAYAQKQKLFVEEAEISLAVERLAAQNHLSVAEFQQLITNSGASFNEFKKNLKQQILYSNFISTFVIPKVKVGADEFNINKARIRKEMEVDSKAISKVDLSEILVYGHLLPASTSIEDAKAMVEQTISSEGFAAAAAKHSHSGSNTMGGELGVLNFADLSPAYKALLSSNVKEGNTETLFTPNSLLFLKVNKIEYARATAQTKITDQMIQDRLRYEKAEKEAESFINSLKDKTFIERKGC